MKEKDYEKNQKHLMTGWLLLLLAGVGFMYFLTGRVIIGLAAAGLVVAGGWLAWQQYHMDKAYIEHVVSELTELCDSLITLEEKAIFPVYEDNQLSKLQNQIFKLVRILKQQKEQSIKDQENIKGLVSDLSHQLKTPLANLRMYTEFLEDESLTSGQQKEYMEVIQLSVDRLNFLSESMIKVSRLESGLISLGPEMLSLDETILKAVKDVFPKARKKNVEITYSGGEELMIYHDRRWTAEAIFNLLDNAVKYSPQNSVVEIKVKKLGMFVAVEVSDMAPVIEEEERTKVFQRFYRGQHSRNQEGIGIGLYLAREIVVKQGGYLNLIPGQNGNVFGIFLPIDAYSKK